MTQSVAGSLWKNISMSPNAIGSDAAARRLLYSDYLTAAIAAGSGVLFPVLLWLSKSVGLSLVELDFNQIAVLTIVQIFSGMCLVLWRHYKVLCIGIFLVVLVIFGFIGGMEIGFQGLSVAFLCALSGYSLKMSRALIILALITGADSIGLVLNWWYLGDVQLSDIRVGAVLTFLNGLAIIIFGAWLQARRRNDLLEIENLNQRHLRNVERAVAAERRRLAGELHDVAAHHLAAITVQAAALRHLIDHDPTAAKDAAAQLRHQAKLTLSGMRTVVESLREAGDTPGLADIPELIETVHDLGVAVVLDKPEKDPDVTREVDAASYRIVQQGISNALQHAPGSRITVLLSASDWLTITVRNTAPTREGELGSGGAGLQLMAERVNNLGGHLNTTATAEGGWELSVRLPLNQGDKTQSEPTEVDLSSQQKRSLAYAREEQR